MASALTCLNDNDNTSKRNGKKSMLEKQVLSA